MNLVLIISAVVLVVPAWSQTPRNRIVSRQGQLHFESSGRILSGLGYGSLCPHTVSDENLKLMLSSSKADVARIVFVLGDSVYNICGKPGEPGAFPLSWDGRNQFDYSFLVREIDRRLRVNPQLKFVIQVALDGSKNWIADHPGNQMDPQLSALGIPDYNSDAWKIDAKRALQDLVQTAEASPYRDAIIGYELFNGISFDSNFPITLAGESTRTRFSNFLRKKYGSNSALRLAWNQPRIRIENALPVTAPIQSRATQLAPLFAPATYQAVADTQEFKARSYEEVVFHFAGAIKEASNRNALVGIRGGEILTGWWENEEGSDTLYKVSQQRTMDFYRHPDLDFFEVWDNYGKNRTTGELSGTINGNIPVEGLRLLGKKFVLQNDYRVAAENGAPYPGWDTNPGFGYDSNIYSSLAKQMKIFSASLVQGLGQYLFEMSWQLGQSTLLPLWDTQKTISETALNLPMESQAEVAIVIDPALQRYFSIGFNSVAAGTQWLNKPGFQNYLAVSPMSDWGRIGANYDVIFFDQVATARKYKVYWFYHTMALSDAQVLMIHQTLKKHQATGVFLYADGMMDERGSLDVAQLGTRISKLTGFQVVGSQQQRFVELSPTEQYKSLGGDVGSLKRWDIRSGLEWSPGFPVQVNVFPSFKLDLTSAPEATPLANYTRHSGEVAAAIRKHADGYWVVYSASPAVPPSMMRSILKVSGVHITSDDEDLISENASFLGWTADSTRQKSIQLKAPSALYEVYRDVELPAAQVHSIPQEANQAYLFFKGTRNQFRMATWVWRETLADGTYDSDFNQGLSVARTKDFVSWENTCGQPLSLPITYRSAAVVDPISIQNGLHNNLQIGEDSSGQLVVSYQKSISKFSKTQKSSLATQVVNARLENGNWKIYPMTEWTTLHNISGSGSLPWTPQTISFGPVLRFQNRMFQQFTAAQVESSGTPVSGIYELSTNFGKTMIPPGTPIHTLISDPFLRPLDAWPSSTFAESPVREPAFENLMSASLVPGRFDLDWHSLQVITGGGPLGVLYDRVNSKFFAFQARTKILEFELGSKESFAWPYVGNFGPSGAESVGVFQPGVPQHVLLRSDNPFSFETKLGALNSSGFALLGGPLQNWERNPAETHFLHYERAPNSNDLGFNCSGAVSETISNAQNVCPEKFTSPLVLWTYRQGPGWTKELVDDVWSGANISYDLYIWRDHLFVAYYAANRFVKIAMKKPNGTWEYAELDQRFQGWDSHNYLVVEVDTFGDIHVSADMHGTPLNYWRSNGLNLTTFARRTMVGNSETQATYPRFFRLSSGDLMFAYRVGYAGGGEWIYNRYQPLTRNWVRQLGTSLFGAH